MKIRKKGITKVSVFFIFAIFLLFTSLVSAQTYDQTKDPYTFSGKVGIGTTTPNNKLEVFNGNILLKDNITSGYAASPNKIILQTAAQVTPAIEFCGMSGCGNVSYDSDNGIYTLVGGTFKVVGNIKGTTGLCIGSDCRSSWPVAQNGSNYSFSGNVGIGTTNPEAPLHIVQNGSNSANRNLIVSQHINANQAGLMAFRRSRGTNDAPLALQNGDNVAWFDARPYDGNEYLFDAAHMEFVVSGNVSGNNVPMDFRITTGSSKQNYVPDFIIKNNGYVGIGTTSPQALLHVAGDIMVDGNIAAKYQDLAEYVQTSESLTKGMVVMIDTREVNQVVPSNKAYNTLVAGVVSENPGIILGEGGADKAIIAHTGRVKVKVDTNYGAISTGDLLVTSPVTGYAMKADTDKLKPGMLLGKALEPLIENLQGEILALITLQ